MNQLGRWCTSSQCLTGPDTFRRQGLLKAGLGRSDAGRPSLQDVTRLRAENERLRTKLAQAEAIIGVQGKVHALLEEISKSAASDE